MLLERGEGDDLEGPFVSGRQHRVGGRAVLGARSQFTAVTHPTVAGHEARGSGIEASA
jgi:hypothetical protein